MAKTPQPQLIEAKVSYSFGVKCSLDILGEDGKQVKTYESADYHCSETETFAIPAEMDDPAVQKFLDGRYDMLKEKIDGRVMKLYAETSFYAKGE